MTDPAPADAPHDLVLSPTQIETYDLCPRKWWFKWGLGPNRLHESKTSSQTFGTALHAVVERYLAADDLGRTPDGKPVDLYPEGWQSVVEERGPNKGRVETVTPEEADQIRQLVEAAIEQGVLMRLSGRRIEHEFKLPLVELPDPSAHTGVVRAFVTGFIDCLTHDLVVDHKTSKNMHYAKSPNELKKSPQMLIYGKVAIEEARARGEAPLDRVTFQHNVYCKDPNDLRVRKTTTAAADGGDPTVAQIEAYWESLKDKARAMHALSKLIAPVPGKTSAADGAIRAEDVFKTPEPAQAARACTAFGGCGFRSICMGRESPQVYALRVSRALSVAAAGAGTGAGTTIEQENRPMPSFKEMLAAKKAAAGAGAPPVGASAQTAPPPAAQPQAPVAPAPTVAPSAVATPVAATSPQGNATPGLGLHPAAAPWTRPDCPACKMAPEVAGGVAGLRSGWNTKFAPCGICASRNKKAGATTHENFTEDEVSALREEFRSAIGAGGVRSETREQPVAVVPATEVHPHPHAMGEAPVTTREPVAAPPQEPQQPAVTQVEASPDTATQGESEADGDGDAPREDVAAAPATGGKGIRRGVGRPKQGFTLFVNCMPTRGFASDTIIHLDQVLETYARQMVTELAKSDSTIESYYGVNAFARRDHLARAASEIAKDFGTGNVIARGHSTDFAAFLDAIRPHAGRVVEAAA